MQANERVRGPDLNQDIEMKRKKSNLIIYLLDYQAAEQLKR